MLSKQHAVGTLILNSFLFFAAVLPVPRSRVQPGAAGEEADQGAAPAAAAPAAVRHAAGLRDSPSHPLLVSQVIDIW